MLIGRKLMQMSSDFGPRLPSETERETKEGDVFHRRCWQVKIGLLLLLWLVALPLGQKRHRKDGCVLDRRHPGLWAACLFGLTAPF